MFPSLPFARAATIATALCSLVATESGGAEASYRPIAPRDAATVVLNGHDLTLEQIIAVARHGAHVELAPDARARAGRNYGLLLEAAAEAIPVYWFNRGAGDQRETVLFDGDPTSANNRPLVANTQRERFLSGANAGTGPEVADEEIVRAMMVVRANAMSLDAPSPQLMQMLLDFLNRRITPVVASRGTLGEGDLAQLGNVGAAMVGAGEVYLGGERMGATAALKAAGLAPLAPFGADDSALTSSNAYATGQAALVLADARAALEWADLVYAIDLDGMNSSITPLSFVVQRNRPEPWLNWHAARVLSLLKGGYLFDDDRSRIIQDPESLRASSIRQASAWEEWDALARDVLRQVNSSDHNPAVMAGVGPSDSWELATPQMKKFYVKGGALSHGEHGYIVSNANWDPYPMANRLESFVIALGNMDVAVTERIERFRNPFFTGVRAQAVLPQASAGDWGFAPVDLQQEMQSLMSPVAPSGSAIIATVEDLQAQTRIKVQRARRAVDVTMDLLAYDLLQGALWMDVRRQQDGGRRFGAVPEAAWAALRARVALAPSADGAATQSAWTLTREFMRATPASRFYVTELPH
jgi:histidine ammonia-lyase